MLTSKYKTIYEDFLGEITDPSFANYTEDIAYEISHDFLKKSVSKPSFRKMFSTFKMNDETATISYELSKSSGDDNYDKCFVENVLVKSMAIAWLTPQVKSTANIHQMFSGKEAKFYSQSNHLGELREMLKTEKKELESLITEYNSIYNSYLGRKA